MLWHDLNALKVDEQLILSALVEQFKEHGAFDSLTRSIKRILLIKTDEHVPCTLIVRSAIELKELLKLVTADIGRHTKALVISLVLPLSLLIGLISLGRDGRFPGIGLRSNGVHARS